MSKNTKAIAVGFRFPPADVELLKRSADATGMDKTTFARQAVASLARAYGVKAPRGSTAPIPLCHEHAEAAKNDAKGS